MAAIRRRDRAGEWWVDFRYRGRRIRRPSPDQSRRGTEAYERTLRNEFVADDEAGRDPFTGPPPRLGEFADRWVRDYVLPTNRLSSQRAKLNMLRIHLLPQLGSVRLSDITTARVDAFRASLHARNLAPKSINNILSALRCCLTTAKEWSLIRTVPTFHWLRVPTQGYKYLTPEQATKLLAATRPGLWRVLILFMLHTGVRFGEAAGVTWDDLELDTEQPLVHIRRSVVLRHVGPTKTGRPRDIPLTPSVVEALRGFERHHPYVFSLRDGDFIVPTTTLSYRDRSATPG